MKQTMVVFAALLFAINAWAAPNITGVTGDSSNGESATISGADFGTGSTIISWDDFEAHTVGATIEYKTPVVGPTWTLFRLSPQTDFVNVEDDYAHSGEKSVKIEWTDETVNSFGWAGRGPYTQLYYTFWHREVFPGSITSANRKLVFTYGNVASCGETTNAPNGIPLIPEGQVVWGFYPNNSTQQPDWNGMNNMSSNTTYGTGNTLYYSETKDRWGRWEYYQQLNDPYNCTVNVNCNGILEYYYDGVKLYYRDDYKHTFCDGEYTDIRFGQMFQGHVDNQTFAWFDDVCILSSRARVEIGNAPTWDDCTHREIQRHTSWGSTITVTVNAGTFTEGTVVYLYVVDSAGVPSNGYPVTIGGTVTPELTTIISGVVISGGTIR